MQVSTSRHLHKLLLVFAAVTIASILVLSGVLIMRLLPDNRYVEALGDYAPTLALNHVAGLEGPAAHLGEVLVLRSDRCINRATDTTTKTAWTSVDRNPIETYQNTNDIIGQVTPGCATPTLNLEMPEQITPGQWYIQGVVIDTKGSTIRYWTSGPFKVVP